MSKSYQNTSEYELMVPNVGVVKAGEVIETELIVENPNLRLVEGELLAAPTATPVISAPVAHAELPQTIEDNA
jgi:hypothetical protein